MIRFRRNLGFILLSVAMIVVLISACSGGGKSTASNITSDTPSNSPAKEKESKAEQTNKETNPNAEIYLYKGADRDTKLTEKAKEEGELNLYTGIVPDDAAKYIDAFEKKYGIKVNMWRSSGEQVTQRMINEAKAKRFGSDVVLTAGGDLEKLAREQVLSEFYSPYFEDFQGLLPSHKKWATASLNFYVMAWNTQKVKSAEVPNTYEDLLNPKWKGNFVIESEDQLWFAFVVKQMGEEKGLEYFKKLAQNGAVIRKGHSLISQLIAAGEAPLSLTVYNHSAEKLNKEGAPVDWKPLQPMVGEPHGIGVNVQAKHPYAALLFSDFIMSPSGQKIVEKIGRSPASKKLTTKLNNFKYQMADPGVMLDEWDKWDKLWQDLFLKNAKK